MNIEQKSKKVLLIGWDAADWKIIHPLLDAGKMPNLEKLINSGVMGNLAPLYPDLSPMLWTLLPRESNSLSTVCLTSSSRIRKAPVSVTLQTFLQNKNRQEWN
jgi:predicted AlkP superfamily phosphohydrolase/phosphomutase